MKTTFSAAKMQAESVLAYTQASLKHFEDLGDETAAAYWRGELDALQARINETLDEYVSRHFRAEFEAHPDRETDPGLAIASAMETAAEALPRGVTGSFDAETLTFRAD